MALKEDLTFEQGRTFKHTVRWETTPLIYKPITNALQTAPATLTVPNHGAKDGWRAAVVDMVGMTELNVTSMPPPDEEMRRLTVVDANTVQFNEVSAALFKAYKSGGFLAYYTPIDLSGYVGRLTVRDRIGGAALLTLTDAGGGVSINASAGTITLNVTATATAAFTWTKGVYDLELQSPTGVVTALMYGAVSVTKEVTT